MVIKVHQAIHGYKEGHQLLASSVELSIDARKVLLFQSDLSGPTIYKGFEAYLTGYLIPDSKYYAFAKTWYAGEMPRPGCVWTQTLLIELVDVGKIVEFESLTRFFKRPQLNLYEEFESSLEIKLESPEVSFTYNKRSYDEIATAVYDFPTQAIVIAADTSQTFQSEVLQIWSDQWPRLRRSFTFCTGAMSPKNIRGKSFDLQIVPNTISFRQFEGSQIIRPTGTETPESDWLPIIHENDKNNLRQFFWIFGSDIDGSRANYIRILTLYKVFTEKPSVDKLGDAIRINVPNPNDGRSIKQFLFNSDQLFNFSAYDILAYLIQTADLYYLPIAEYNLTERLAKAVNENQIPFVDSCKLFISAQPGRLSDTFWDLIAYNFDDSVAAIGLHMLIADEILSRNSAYCGEFQLWQYDSRTSNFAYRWIIEHYPDLLPKPFLDAALGANVEISSLMLANYGQRLVPGILSWSNETHIKIPSQLAEKIAKQYRPILIEWIHPQLSTVPFEILVILFNYGNNSQAFELPFSANDWLKILKRFDEYQPSVLPTVYTIVLSIGFQNRVHNSEMLVVRTFDSVFKFSARAQLGEIWEILPKDLEGFEEDEDYSLFEAILHLFKINPSKKKYQIPYWDHCELLVVTYTHRFLKCGWSLQNFTDGLSSRVPFERTIAYCVTFRRGREHIAALIHQLDTGNLRCFNFQRTILKAIKNEIE